MTDITDLFSSVSRTRVSPQKSFVASYTLTGSFADTGATLSVANGQFYAVTMFYSNVSGTLQVKVLEGASTKQVLINRAVAANYHIASNIYQNTSGSTQTVKVQATSTAAGSLLNITLISGSFVVGVNPNGSSHFPINAYIQNLEIACASSDGDGATPYVPVTVLNLSQMSADTGTVLASNLNIFVTGINISAQATQYGGSVATTYTTAFAAFDFDGKTLAI